MSDDRRRHDDENLAYGEDYSQSRGYGDQPEGQRSLVGDALNKIRTRVDKYGRPQQNPYGYGSSSGQPQTYNQSVNQPGNQGGYQTQPQSQYQNPNQTSGQPPYVGGPPPQPQQPKPDFTDKIFSTLHGTIHSIGTDVAGLLGTKYDSHHQAYTGPQQGQPNVQGAPRNRFDSFAPERYGNDVKWFVDGCSYMWAVSEALERARESIWILDWWLSPELYLRRPPAANEEWRLDRVLKRAADRGVKINIIVYKEVTQALTLSSHHTKHALEDLSPNIGVFRHPDHLPDRQTAHSSIISGLQGLKLDAQGLSKLGADTLRGLYGLNDGVILYWAHHEKLCLIDKNIAFMGGLDLCYGRWDTNHHSITDAHPSDLNKIVFPGQDFNNARVMDFDDVAHPFQNKLDRTKSSRMGWSDISICLRGDCVRDLGHHFTDRWNFIYDEKYNVRTDVRYARLPASGSHHTGEGSQTSGPGNQQSLQPGQYPPPPGSQTYTQPPWQATSAIKPSPSTQPYGSSPQPPSSQYGSVNPSSSGQYTGSAQPPPAQYGASTPTPAGQYNSGAQQYGDRPLTPQQPSGQYGTSQQHYGSRPHTPQAPSTSYNSSQQQSSLPSSGQAYSTQQDYGSSQQYQPGQQQSQMPQPSQSQYNPDYQQPSQYQSGQSQSQTPQPSQPQYGSGHEQPQQSAGGHQQQAQLSQPSQQQYSAYHQSSPQPPQLSQPPQPSQEQYGSGYQPQPQTPQPGQPSHPSGYPVPSVQEPSLPPQGSQYGNTAQELPTTQPQYQAYGHSGTRGLDEPYESSSTTRGIDDESEFSRGFGENPDYYGTEGDRDRGRKNQRPNSRGRFDQYRSEGRKLGSELGNIGNMIQHRVENKVYDGAGKVFGSSYNRPQSRAGGPMSCQLIRSCTKWSNGTPTEHSIQNAYIDVIMNSQHFVYIENQFFITATGDKQKPVKNQIGRALVDRILRAARSRERYHVIVVMPAIPAFAGDFVDDESLGTRAICEFQYNSICRGGNSIMEQIAQAGFNPMDYIRFYNLRNYDRINYTTSMIQAQSQSGVGYEDARKQQEQMLGAGYAGQGYPGYGQPQPVQNYGQTQPAQSYGQGQTSQPYSQNQPSQTYGQGQQPYGGNAAQQYQGAAHSAPTQSADRWDSVASCYMLHGEDIRTVPWSGPPEAEIDAFVSEELYVHSKVMIADDRVVICGSANINDRSMLGYHDSEIALFINDPTPIQTTMAGRPYQASRFASSLRRQLLRKHLGLLPAQNYQRPDDNFLPLGPPNLYDWGSPEDHIVADPLSDTFLSLWNTRARTNTEVYRKAFRAVPDDYVRSWNEYKEFYEYYFHKADAEAAGRDKNDRKPARVEYGHVVNADFPGGVKELKELLSKVKGTVVEMPLCFLQTEDIAKEGVGLNAFTEEIYT